MNFNNVNSRRNFIGKLAATASLTGFAGPLLANAGTSPKVAAKMASEADAWFKNVKGEHRIVYDAPEHHEGFPFIWSWVFYQTNNQTGTTDDDMATVLVLRHNAIPFAMKDEMWKKYNLGKVFGITDKNTNAEAERNLYYLPQEKDYPIPGIDGIQALQDRGAMLCVCNMAIMVYSGAVAQSMNLNPEEVKNDWLNNLLPGVQVVPSGVWAVGRAQEHGCSYCFAG